MIGIRKLIDIVEEVHSDGGRPVDPPTRTAAVLAVIHNPLAGTWADDLTPLIDQYCEPLGQLLAERCATLLGAPAEAYGKGALVGLAGEVEHASAIIHNLRFGNPVRSAAGEAKTLLPAAEKRGAAGATLDVPLKHVQDQTMRSHHQTFEVRVGDAPLADEIVIVIAMASAGRPHARLGEFGSDFAAAAA
jgi:hypothetical protein